MCGENAECHTTLQDIEIRNIDNDGCDQFKCSFDRDTSNCKRHRGPEVCEKITQYYNPLYLDAEVDDSSSTPHNFPCDDEKGKYVGTYQCLGNSLDLRRLNGSGI